MLTRRTLLAGVAAPAFLPLMGKPATAAPGVTTTPEDWGAAGDDIADDTLPLQAAFNSLAGPTAVLHLPGKYRVIAPILIPLTQHRRICGNAWGSSVIRQDTDNVPVLIAPNEDTHSIVLDDVALTWTRRQPATMTGALGLQFGGSAAGQGHGWYFWDVRRLTVDGAHTGIGTAGSGALPIWGCAFDGLKLLHTSYTAIAHKSPVAIGMPITTYRDVKILNSGGPAPSGPAIWATGAELLMEQVDVEDWAGRIVYAVGGGTVTLRSWHVERHAVSGLGYLFEIADGQMSIEGLSLHGTVNSPGQYAALLRVGNSTASLEAKRIRLDWTIAAGFAQLVSAAGGKVYLRDICDLRSNVILPAPSWDAPTVAAIRAND